MTDTKRSNNINLPSMRKYFSPKPLAISLTSVFLTACADESSNSTVYTNVNECINENPEATEQCNLAYEKAVEEAQRTAPKYSTQKDCEYDFGADRCQTYQSGGSSFFMPFMAGYMLSNLMSPNRYSQPMFISSSPYSRYRYRWIGADGYDYGDLRKRNFRTSSRSYKPKPTVSRTIKRGGFGSSVRAKSSWGSSKSSSRSWGG